MAKAKQPARDTEVVAIADLTPHPQNYKSHPDAQLEHIAQSLREHGLYRNIVVARDLTILAGHGVVEAATLIGWETIAVVRLDVAPDDPAAIKVLLADNELGRFADVDDRMLTEHLKTLADLGQLIGTGYDDQMLANLIYITRLESEIQTQNDAAAWAGMPDFEPFATPYKVVVSLDSEEDREKLLAELGVEVINRKDRETWSVRWPPRAKEDLSSLFFEPAAET